MFDIGEILSRLQDGETAESIAHEFSEALNNAEKKYAETNAQLQKEDDFEELVAAAEKFFYTWYPDLFKDARPVDTAVLLKDVDAYASGMVDLKNAFADLMPFLDTVGNKPNPKVTVTQKNTTGKNTDDIINGFLGAMGLL